MVVKAAYKEACLRYPESVPALVWFASALGLFESALTMEHINWARSVIGEFEPSAAIINE